MKFINEDCTQINETYFKRENLALSWPKELVLMWTRYQHRRHLMRLPDYLLKDIGVEREQL